jgi:hypothetical protein
MIQTVNGDKIQNELFTSVEYDHLKKSRLSNTNLFRFYS